MRYSTWRENLEKQSQGRDSEPLRRLCKTGTKKKTSHMSVSVFAMYGWHSWWCSLTLQGPQTLQPAMMSVPCQQLKELFHGAYTHSTSRPPPYPRAASVLGSQHRKRSHAQENASEHMKLCTVEHMTLCTANRHVGLAKQLTGTMFSAYRRPRHPNFRPINDSMEDRATHSLDNQKHH